MGEVVRLDEQRPHWAGECKCLACGHEFTAVAPAGTVWVECLECGLHKATAKAPMGAEVGDVVMTCNCGCEYFYMTLTGSVCGCCGTGLVFD